MYARTARPLRRTLIWAAAGALFVGCGGGDDDAAEDADTTPADATDAAPAPTAAGTAPADATDAAAPTAEGTAPAATESPGATTGDATGGGGDDIDVCALVPAADVESVIGVPPGTGQREDLEGLFFGCRYEDDAVTQVVSLGVIAHDDADQAAGSFEFGADQYPAVDGIGERAYNSQPIDDISVLSGRYEISVGLYFIDDDDAVEHEMAKELAAMLIDRLP